MRQTWNADAQLFVSYVRSRIDAGRTRTTSASLFTNLDTPLLEPDDGIAPTAADMPHRLRGWATFGAAPRAWSISPAVDGAPAFRISVQDVFRHYVGGPIASGCRTTSRST